MWLQKSIEIQEKGEHRYSPATTRLLLAMVEHQTGQSVQARADYAQTLQFIERKKIKLGAQDFDGFWHYSLILEIIRREAAKTLGVQAGEQETTNTQEE